MPLILPRNYFSPINLIKTDIHNSINYKTDHIKKANIRLAIINIMPEAEKYEELILNCLINSTENIEIIFVRLINHKYGSSDKKHLQKFYITFNEAISSGKIDGLIITGAPVELLTFNSITYYNELIDILDYAKNNVKSTLGICWGGIIIGHYLGIKSNIFSKKLFGVFKATYTPDSNWILPTDSVFYCPHSRYAGFDEKELLHSEKNEKINILCNSDEAGSFIFESKNHTFISHLGHPEYNINRIMFEYERDKKKKLDIIPQFFDTSNPINNWNIHSVKLITSWMSLLKS